MRNTYTSIMDVYKIAEDKAIQLGCSYMHGTASLADVQALLYSWQVIESGGFTKTCKLISQGVERALLESEYTYDGAAIVASRAQPEQDASEVASIYARKIRKPRYTAKPPYQTTFTAKDVANGESWTHVHMHIA